MKKIVTKEVDCCDVCGAETYPATCLKCGRQYCYDCRKTGGVEYGHGVYFSGTRDGFYCTGCDAELTQSRADQMHQAYRAIESLKNELAGFSADFDKRRKQAEENLERLQGRK